MTTPPTPETLPDFSAMAIKLNRTANQLQAAYGHLPSNEWPGPPSILVDDLLAVAAALAAQPPAVAAQVNLEAFTDMALIRESDILREIASNIEIMLGSAEQHSDGESVIGYTIKTGALHRVIGLLVGNGFRVAVPVCAAKPPAGQQDRGEAPRSQYSDADGHNNDGAGEGNEDAARLLGSMAEQLGKIAAIINYPEEWDTAVYPTLEDACDAMNHAAFCHADNQGFDYPPTAGEATATQGDGWEPIETAPDDELVVVFHLQKDGDEEVDMHTLDFKEDGCWFYHNEHYEHYCMVAKGGDVGWTGPSEEAPYTHWKRLGAPCPAAPGNGEGKS